MYIGSAENFSGTGPDHHCRLRPREPHFSGYGPNHRRRARGPSFDEHGNDSDNDHRNIKEALPDMARQIILPIPFVSRSCNICLQHGKGEYILLNLNNTIQQVRNHHYGVEVLYSCKTCGKTYKNTQRTVPFLNEGGPPRTRTQAYFVEFVNKPFRPKEVGLNMNGIFTLRN